jgi:mRNA-degrading endonuclease RelE of RelBE toxin-antitoxin system
MWHVNVSGPAAKALARVPSGDHGRLLAALVSMAVDPFAGDVRMLDANLYRRRVGSHRITFALHPALRFVQVTAITRRTSTASRKR